MSSFTSPLWVTPLENGRDWRLIRSFTYHLGSKASRCLVKAPRHFVTDFASIPRFFWFLPDWGTYNKAPVIHDVLYSSKKIMDKPITRKQADDIFLEAMLIDFRNHKQGKLVAYLEYLAVRIFGWLAW